MIQQIKSGILIASILLLLTGCVHAQKVQVGGTGQIGGKTGIQTNSAATLSIITGSCPSGTLNVVYTCQLAAQNAIGNVTWTLNSGSLPNGLSIVGSTIFGTPSPSAGTSSFQIKATDSASPTPQTATQNLTINIGCPPLIIGSPQIVPPGTQGLSFPPYNFLASSAGSGSLTWTQPSGTYPPGMTALTTGGVESGTPSQAGNFSFTVQVQDSCNVGTQTASELVSQVINSNIALNTPPNLGTVTAGQPVNLTITASGGTQPYTYALQGGSTLPGTLALNASTGIISGTVSIAGVYTFTIKVTDSLSNSSQPVTFTLTVACAPLNITTVSPLSSCTQGAQYPPFQMTNSGGFGQIHWTGPGLAAVGLAISDSGLITGTCTQIGVFNPTITATDSCSTPQTASGQFQITMKQNIGPLVFNDTSLPNATAGVSYSAGITVSGGIPPYTFNATPLSGHFPAGLSLNSSGAVSGTATVAEADTPDIQVSDAEVPPQVAHAVISITSVCPLITSNTTSLNPAKQGTAYSQQVQASGGYGTLSYAATGLPTGLSINSSTGLISGTPSTSGTFAVIVTITDQCSPTPQNLPLNLALQVNTNLAITTSPTLPQGQAGISYSAGLTAIGGTTPYSWLITSGSCAGLSLSSGGLLSGTPTTAGTCTFTVQVTDALSNTQSQVETLTIIPSNQVALPDPNLLTWNTTVANSPSPGNTRCVGTVSGFTCTATYTAGQFQNALTDLQCGETLVIQENLTGITGNFTLPAKDGGHNGPCISSQWINIKSAAISANLPVEGTRITPCFAGIPATVNPPNHTVSLAWTASTSPGVTGYNVYRALASTGPFTKINSSAISGTSFVDSSVQNGTTYFYEATALGPGGESTDSNTPNAVIPLGSVTTPLNGYPSYSCTPSPTRHAPQIIFGVNSSLTIMSQFTRITGVDFTSANDHDTQTTLLNIGSNSGCTHPDVTCENLQPDHVILDRVLLHGDAQRQTNRAVQINGARWVAVLDSYCYDINVSFGGGNGDSQCIQAGTGANLTNTGWYKFANNFLAASTESAQLFGGAFTEPLSPSTGFDGVPHDDWEFQNWGYKNPLWNPQIGRTLTETATIEGVTYPTAPDQNLTVTPTALQLAENQAYTFQLWLENDSGGGINRAIGANSTATLTCGTAGACGTITSVNTTVGTGIHASQNQKVFTYTAPAAIPTGGTVTVTFSTVVNDGRLGTLGNNRTLSAAATVTIVASSPTHIEAVGPISPTLRLQPSYSDANGNTRQFCLIFNAIPNFTSVSTTWAVDGVTNGNSTVGTIDTSGLYCSPGTTGSHTISATASDSTVGSSVIGISSSAPILAFDGKPYPSKNLWEIKEGSRVLFENSYLENSWGGNGNGGGQPGYCILDQTLNQANQNLDGNGVNVGYGPQYSSDITIRYIKCIHSGTGIVAVPLNAALGMHRFQALNLLFDDANYQRWGNGWTKTNMDVQTGGTGSTTVLPWTGASNPVAANVSFKHITFEGLQTNPFGWANNLAQAKLLNFTWQDSIYAAKGSSTFVNPNGDANDCNTAAGTGANNSEAKALVPCFTNYTFNHLILADSTAKASVFTSTPIFETASTAIGYVNYNNGNGGDYRLCKGSGNPASTCTAASPFASGQANQASDGSDMGADVQGLITVEQNVRSGIRTP